VSAELRTSQCEPSACGFAGGPSWRLNHRIQGAKSSAYVTVNFGCYNRSAAPEDCHSTTRMSSAEKQIPIRKDQFGRDSTVGLDGDLLEVSTSSPGLIRSVSI
jgi:hypothetical protein